MNLKKNGTIYNLISAFGIFRPENCKTVCGVFWMILLVLLATVGGGGAIAALLGTWVAGIAASLVTGYITVPAGLTIVVLVLGSVLGAVFYIASAIYDMPQTEVSKFVCEAYNNHKEKHCTLVTFEE